MKPEILRSDHVILYPSAKRPIRKLLLWGLFFAVFSGIFLAIVPVKFTSRSNEAYRAAARQDIAELSKAIEGFYDDNGRFPSNSEGLSALSNAPRDCPDWEGPYMTKPLTSDPWGHPYIYTFPGAHNPNGFDLLSMGRDSRVSGEDDLNNWTIKPPPAK